MLHIELIGMKHRISRKHSLCPCMGSKSQSIFFSEEGYFSYHIIQFRMFDPKHTPDHLGWVKR